MGTKDFKNELSGGESTTPSKTGLAGCIGSFSVFSWFVNCVGRKGVNRSFGALRCGVRKGVAESNCTVLRLGGVVTGEVALYWTVSCPGGVVTGGVDFGVGISSSQAR